MTVSLSIATPRPEGSRALFMALLWRGLHHSSLPVLGCLLALGLGAAYRLLPQLPGQLRDEPVTAARWLLDAAAGYGFWGNLAVGLGLFNVSRSPLLYLALTLLALTFATRLADELAALRQLHHLRGLLTHPDAPPSTPLPIPAPPTVFRNRTLLPTAPDASDAALHVALAQTYAPVMTHSLDQASPAAELRYLGLCHARLAPLRPLIPAGLLLAVCGLWLVFALGRQFVSPLLAPGDSYRAFDHDLALHYQTPIAATAPVPRLHIIGAGQNIEIEARTPVTIRLGDADFLVQPTASALWLAASDGAPLLVQPGRDRRRNAIGLAFAPDAGEESILLPDFSAGLRIVPRRSGANGFALELYRSDSVEPVYREQVRLGEAQSIPLDDRTTLTVVAAPGLRVIAQRAPGYPLVWLGFLTALAGSIAQLRRPGYVLIQAQPWPPASTLLTIQSDHPESGAALLSALGRPLGAAQPDSPLAQR